MIKCHFRSDGSGWSSCGSYRSESRNSAVGFFHRFFLADRVGGAFGIDVVAQSLCKIPTVPHHQLFIWHYVSSCIKVNVLLMLACDQIHDLQVKCGRDVAHPIRFRYVGAVQVIILIVLENLQRPKKWKVKN